MSLQELAQYTYQGLKAKGIIVTLSGGACVSIYSKNAYQSGDLDFIRNESDSFEKATAAMIQLGFERKGRHFIHPQSELFVEFPTPPLSVGEEVPKTVKEYPIQTSLGKLSVRMLSPTDCVKDRLCGFFHWNDLQSLEQAIMVSQCKKVDFPEIEHWAERERMSGKYQEFQTALKEKQRAAAEGKKKMSSKKNAKAAPKRN